MEGRLSEKAAAVKQLRQEGSNLWKGGKSGRKPQEPLRRKRTS